MYGARRGSMIYHILLRDCLMDILNLSDVNISVTYCKEMGDKFYLYPIGILVEKHGQNHKAYALEDNKSLITFLFLDQ